MGKQRKKAKKKAKKRGLIILKYILSFIVTTLVVIGLFVYSVYAGLWGKLPDAGELKVIHNDEASLLYSEDGELLGKYYIENRTNIDLDSIAPYAVDALIATEDIRFYEHKGIDQISILRVFFKTLLLGDRSAGGGSTLSQQLAKNLYPREEQQVTFIPVVKLKEMFTAYQIEKLYTKDEILALYLNTVSFGENTFGIESAAQKYFSTNAFDLSLPQAATLIGILKGPSWYNPRLHPERALQRRNTVISQMVKYQFLIPEEGERWKKTDLDLRYQAINHYSGLAPYLREKIRLDAARILDEYNAKYGTVYNLYKDGLILTATIDAEMQRYAENAVASHMKILQQAYYDHLGKKEPWDSQKEILDNAIKNSHIYQKLKHRGLQEEEILQIMNEKKAMIVYDAVQGENKVDYSSVDSIKHYLKLLHPGMIAVEPQSGKIKAWVGGIDYKYFQYDQVTAPRQAGSAFKPVVYSAAIAHGARLDAYYKNEQITYPEYDNWTPKNSNNRYDGYYTLKGALSQSINTIAVEVLLQTGIDTVIMHARELGIESELPPYPSLALGVADIPLQEMVKPYMVFANDGKLVQPYYLDEIKDNTGNIIFKAIPPVSRTVLPAEDAQAMTNILMAVIDEGTGYRLRSNYSLYNEIAGKTGTTQHHADGWFIGYNPRIVVGIRVGANDAGIHFNSMSLGQGANMALPVFGRFMQQCLHSPIYVYWNNLSFPAYALTKENDLKVPDFKEHLNLLEQIINKKLEKPQKTDLPEQTEEKKKVKGFFKKIGNIFKSKQND